MVKKLTQEDFEEKCNAVHKWKYDYSKANYINSKTKVCIICPHHGEFWQIPNDHMRGVGCKSCADADSANKRRLGVDGFVKKSQEYHGTKYDYSKVEYHNSNTKVCIICPTHGEFWQAPRDHVRGIGCPKCGRNSAADKTKYSINEFKSKSNEIHGGKYDYSNVQYINNATKVCINCPTHGEFWQAPREHLQGKVCPKCSNRMKLSSEEFIEKAVERHGMKYDYTKANYTNSRETVCIICPTHGEFSQIAHDHIEGKGCPKCGQVMSKAEDDIISLLSDVQPQQRDRDILDKQEIDIYIPQLKLGIEYNGLRWHSEEFGKDRKYHYNKMAECNSKGIRLIQIFEDEWVNHREVCESKLKHICGLDTDKPKIFARKCSVREITNPEAKEFLDKNHIQGFASATVYLGCYTSDNQLVGVMNFKREKEGFWDLNRFATDINFNCVGIGGKLFKHFTEHYEYQEIKSFADRRWTTDPSSNLYTKLGFDFVEHIRPDYRYYCPQINRYERFHKFGFRKQILHRKYGVPLTMTEYEMCNHLGFHRIWDCGLIKYVFKKKQ